MHPLATLTALNSSRWVVSSLPLPCVVASSAPPTPLVAILDVLALHWVASAAKIGQLCPISRAAPLVHIQYVVALGAELKMFGVEAWRVVALMAHDHFTRYVKPKPLHRGEPVRPFDVVIPAHAPIAMLGNRSRPFPAAALGNAPSLNQAGF